MADPSGNAPDLPGETVTDLRQIAAPWGKEISLKAVTYDSGMRAVRMRIREGRRFTDMELDPDTVHGLIDILGTWLHSQPPEA